MMGDEKVTLWTDRPVTATAFRIVEDVGDGLRRVQLTPWGTVDSEKGMFAVDEKAAAAIIDAFDQRNGEIVVDFEHQTLGGAYASPDGTAPAAGWIVQVFAEPGRGLFALVRWNPRAAKLIRAGEYRYLSPVLMIRKSDGRAVGLHSAAVTNLPAIDGMQTLAATRRAEMEPQDETEMRVMADQPAATTPGNAAVEAERLIGELRAALREKGVTVEGTDRNAILQAAIEAIVAMSKSQAADAGASSSGDAAIANSARQRLGLAEDASTDEVLLALSMIDARTTEVAAMRDAEADRRAKELVDAQVRICDEITVASHLFRLSGIV